MSDEQAFGSGEVGRSLVRIEKVLEALAVELRERHHALNAKVDEYIGPVAVLKEQTAEMRKKLADHDTAIVDAKVKSGQLTLMGTALALAVGLIPWPWKLRP